MNKLRIVQRKDGAIFTWTPVLDAMPEMVAGWLHMHEDGKREIVLDRATSRELDPSTVSQRERLLIEENARLRELLAQAGTGIPALPDALSSSVATSEEVPLPPPIENVEDLTIPVPDEDEPIQFQPEPPVLTRSRLRAMTKAEIEAHIFTHKRDMVIPAAASKDELIEFALEAQGGQE